MEDSKEDKLLSAHEKIIAVKFLSELNEKYDNLKDLATALSDYVEEHYTEKVDNKYQDKDRGIFSVADLSRYINRKALPTEERKNYLLSFVLDKVDPVRLIDKKLSGMRIYDKYFLDTSAIVSDIQLLDKLAFITTRTELQKSDFTKILAVSIDGIPFALALAREMELPIVYIEYDPPLAIDECVTAEVEIFEQKRIQTLYLKEKKIKKGDRFLIVDDIIRSGITSQTIVNMINSCNKETKVPTIVTLIAVGEQHTIKSETHHTEVNIVALSKIAAD